MVYIRAKKGSKHLELRRPLMDILMFIGFVVTCTILYIGIIKMDKSLVSSENKHDWMQMLKHFNHLDICLNASAWTDEINFLETEENFRDIMTVYTKVSIMNPEVLEGLSQVSGSLSLAEWDSTSRPYSIKPKTMGIIFDVPLLKHNVTGPLEICVSLKGSARFLPAFRKPLCIPEVDDQNPNVNQGLMFSKLPKYFDERFCASGYETKMKFNLTIPNMTGDLVHIQKLEMYIYVLIIFGYFLAFFFLLVLIVTMFRYLAHAENLEKRDLNIQLF